MTLLTKCTLSIDCRFNTQYFRSCYCLVIFVIEVYGVGGCGEHSDFRGH